MPLASHVTQKNQNEGQEFLKIGYTAKTHPYDATDYLSAVATFTRKRQPILVGSIWWDFLNLEFDIYFFF